MGWHVYFKTMKSYSPFNHLMPTPLPTHTSAHPVSPKRFWFSPVGAQNIQAVISLCIQWEVLGQRPLHREKGRSCWNPSARLSRAHWFSGELLFVNSFLLITQVCTWCFAGR